MRGEKSVKPVAPLPFSYAEHDLGRLLLQPLTQRGAVTIGAEMAQMPPWSVIGSPPESIVSNLKTEKPGLRRFEAMLRGDLAGLIAIHHPWLHGPYLQLLAIRRPFQRMGLGLDLLKWMEAEARREQARQLWLCVSSFNANARVFYERFGFEETALIEKLASDLSDEVLMRKRLYYE